MIKNSFAPTALTPFFLCVAVFLSTVVYADLSPEFVKDAFPKVLTERPGEKAPSWKTLWDKARHAFHQGQMQQAKKHYQELLLERPLLDEARWENVLVAVYLHQWNDAESHLRTLLDGAPDTTRYLVLLADILMTQGKPKKAIELYEKLLQQPLPEPTRGGVLRSLSSLYPDAKQSREAMVVLEQLYQLQPDNVQVRMRLGMLAFELKEYETARRYLENAIENNEAGYSFLSTLAKSYQYLQLDNLAAVYWKQALDKKPDDIQAHLFLAAFYLKKNDLPNAISSYKFLQEKFPENTAYQKKLAYLYLKDGRPDKSLPFLERYLEQHRDDLVVKKTVSQIRMVMATDFLAIVENEGAMALWKDLTRLTPNRYALYKSMASLLRQKQKWRELIDVLEIMFSQDPGDTMVQEQLARLYLEQHDLSRARRFYDLLAQQGYGSKDFYHGRAKLHILEEKPEAALKDFESLLDLLPKQYEARVECIKLAASLGLPDPFFRHLEILRKQTESSSEARSFWTGQMFQMQVAHGFSGMGFYSQALTIYRSILLKTKNVPGSSTDVTAGAAGRAMALTLVAAGLPFEAQKILLQALYEEREEAEDLVLLARWARDEDRLDFAEKKVRFYQQRLLRSEKIQAGKSWQNVFLQAILAELRGDRQQALQLLQELEQKLRPDLSRYTVPSSVYRRTVKALMRLYLSLDRRQDARMLHQQLADANLHGPFLLPFTLELYKIEGEGRKREELLLQLATDAANDLGALVVIAESFQESGDLHLISSLIDHQGKKKYHSLKLLFLHVESLLAKESMAEALAVVRQALHRFPANDRLLRLEVSLLYRMKEYADALFRAEKISEVRNELWPHRDLLLLQARIHLLLGNRQKADTAVNTILRPSVDKILDGLLIKEGIALPRTQQSRSLWQTLPFFQAAPRSLAEILFQPSENKDEAMSRARRLAAPYYDLYRWQKFLQSEFSDMN